ncbi:MAG: peptidase and in kexin sedolisin, partial [Daejeonella sp.]|nr:peptidase and in kexin sedolisin [Daejeonella sp.]
MRKILIAFLLFSVFSVKAKDDPKQIKRVFKFPQGIQAGNYVAGKLIVKFKKNAAVKNQNGVSALAISGLKIKSGSVLTITPVFSERSSAHSYSVSKAKPDTIGLERIYSITYTSKLSIVNVINELLENQEIEYAEPDYIYHTSYIPNDPSLAIQNHLSQIKAPEAWDIIKNSSNVVIAIVDAGSDLQHEDLAANIFINVKDPVNGIDDDNDGYIDNNVGWDFVGASATNSKQDNDPDVKSDANSHGIHVSGIASAVTNNGKGVSSAAFNAKLLIVKAGADDDPESIYNGYQAIKYAADHEAQIINCSWGGTGGGSFGQDVIDYAVSKNCLVVAAAGNENTDIPEFPAAYDHVLSVTSVNGDDTRSRFHYGYDVDIAAPGVNIYSTFNNNTYGSLSGTSMATPLVSSAAALVKARFPLLTMEQVGEQLRATSDNIDQKNPSFIGRLGKGRLNLLNAVSAPATSVRNVNMTIVDKGEGTIPAGDTIKLFFDLKNFLSPVSGLSLTLSSASTDVVIINNQLSAGNLITDELKTMVGPFNVYIKPTTEDNKNIVFQLNYSANGGAYSDFELFKITAAVDYLNYHVNDIASTITSVGRVGFSDASALNGFGFEYKGSQLLYEGSLMVG